MIQIKADSKLQYYQDCYGSGNGEATIIVIQKILAHFSRPVYFVETWDKNKRFYEEIQWEIIVVTQYCCKEGKSAHQQKC